MLLLTGLVLWMVVHFFPALCRDQRQSVIDRIGEAPYKGLFSLLLVGALVLIVMGWGNASTSALYQPPQGLRSVTVILMWPALILFVSGRLPTDLKRLIRHPQLTGVKLWAVAHLLANGEVRSVMLFTALLAWAVLEVILISRREGPRVKPAPVGWLRSLLPVVVGTLAYVLLISFHASFTGMPVLGTL